MDLSAQFLRRAKQLKIVQKGQFNLASGQLSNIYIDGRSLSLDGLALALIAELFLIKLNDCRSIGGPATGALPLIGATVLLAKQRDLDLCGYYIRSMTKDHGLKRLFEGQIVSPLALVDDTCTTGESLLNLAKLLEKDKHNIKHVMSVIDRGGGKHIQKAGYSYSALLRLQDEQLVIY